MENNNIEINKIYNEDCLEGMKRIKDKSIDMILADLPYGITDCRWDSVIPFKPLWEQYERIIKDKGAIILTGRQPFTSRLILSNPSLFKYELIWQKEKGTDFGNSNIKPLNSHENICVFYNKRPTYNKQMLKGKPYVRRNNKTNRENSLSYKSDTSGTFINDGNRTPISVIKISRDSANKGKNLHPTQKPVALFEYLIKTYTNEGELVLDNAIGSGTTAIACLNTNRNYIGFELDEEIYKIATKRVKDHIKQESLI